MSKLNPLRECRMILGLNMSELGAVAGVSRQYVNRLENGVYVKPNETIVKHLAECSDIEVGLLEAAYYKWQKEKRCGIAQNLGLPPVRLTDVSRPYYTNFKRWRQTFWTSTEKFSKDMCVNPSLVNPYEIGKLRGMPVQLKEVLEDLNLIGEGFKTNAR